MMSKKLAILVSTIVLSGVTLLLGVALLGGEEAWAMPVPGSGSWDTALTGVIEGLDEVTPQGDTHVVQVQGDGSIPIQSDVLNLSDYIGEEVTVYIRTFSSEDGSEILDVIEVGPPESFSAAKA